MNKPTCTSQPSSTTDVELVPYHCEHDAILHTFYLPEDQQQFTGMPDEMLALVQARPAPPSCRYYSCRKTGGLFHFVRWR